MKKKIQMIIQQCKEYKVLLIKTVNPKSFDEAINSNDSNK